jgi:hypothetical protein
MFSHYVGFRRSSEVRPVFLLVRFAISDFCFAFRINSDLSIIGLRVSQGEKVTEFCFLGYNVM